MNPRDDSIINAKLNTIEMDLIYLNKSMPIKTVFFVESMPALQEYKSATPTQNQY